MPKKINLSTFEKIMRDLDEKSRERRKAMRESGIKLNKKLRTIDAKYRKRTKSYKKAPAA